jgi:hypothetical protein
VHIHTDRHGSTYTEEKKNERREMKKGRTKRKKERQKYRRTKEGQRPDTVFF